MTATAWLREDRTELAIARLLDAAGEEFAEVGVDAATMSAIARRAGCSRATLYSYFGDRATLRSAFFSRAALAIAAEAQAHVDPLDDPVERIVEAIMFTVGRVRATPLLAVRFAAGQLSTAATVANDSELLDHISRGFVAGIDPRLAHDPLVARWIIRAIMSLLTLPGRDDAEERELLERFLVPSLLGA